MQAESVCVTSTTMLGLSLRQLLTCCPTQRKSGASLDRWREGFAHEYDSLQVPSLFTFIPATARAVTCPRVLNLAHLPNTVEIYKLVLYDHFMGPTTFLSRQHS